MRRFSLVLFAFCCVNCCVASIRVSDDGSFFLNTKSGEKFVVWGVNYDHDSQGRLLEDYWFDEWDTVCGDFAEIRELGANVVRIHPQTAKFLDDPSRANEKSLSQLSKLLKLAEDNGLYLDITGLGCYHKQDVPLWYDMLDESGRWDAQYVFWEAVAGVAAKSDAVFCYDLMNEPVMPSKKEPTQWLAGEPLGGKYFVQRIALESSGRSSREIAKAWVDKLVSAIRKHDTEHMITVGVIPWAHVWPNAKPLFYDPEVSGKLDFVSVHFYPEKDKIDKSIDALKVYDIGKPLVVEEIFPLKCRIDQMNEFIDRSSDICEGWISFYWGKSRDEYSSSKNNTLTDIIINEWLEYFTNKSKEIIPQTND
jgi:hypothetical protein